MTVVVLDARRTQTIGGSEAASACGVDPYRSRIMLWAEKSGRVEREQAEHMLWGNLLEPVIFAELERRGYEVMPAPADGFREGWLTGHPDGFIPIDGEAGILEVKTAGAWSAQAWHEEAGAPLPYLMQLHHYFALTSREVGLLACLVGGQRLELRTVERDDAVIARMLELEGEFLDYLKRDEPPPPNGSDSANDALRALYPEGGGGVVRLDKAHWKIKRELDGLREQEEAIKRQKAEREQRLKAFMGDAEEAISPFDTPACKWTAYERTSLDTKALKAARPEVYSEFATTKTLRRFTVE
jgi:predicted phage-related endonuclease